MKDEKEPTLQGRYCGPDPQLRGKTALLLNDPDNEGNYRAQFDDMTCTMASGWWPFPKEYFVLDCFVWADNEEED